MPDSPKAVAFEKNGFLVFLSEFAKYYTQGGHGALFSEWERAP
jgi:hypothetical protein